MKKIDKRMIACVLALAFTLSFISTMPAGANAQPLSLTAETEAVGGGKCAAAWGLGIALAISALSPCGVVCASLAWYDLALIGAYC